MARPTDWIHQLDRAIAELNAMTTSIIDRRALETLLDVSSRQAVRILRRLGAYEAGASLLIERPELLQKLQVLREDPQVQFQCNRKQRVQVELARARQEQRARQIEIPTVPDVWNRRVVDLPSTVSIRPGQLEVTFKDARDLLRQLFELSQAIVNDYGRFQYLCDPQPSSAAIQIVT